MSISAYVDPVKLKCSAVDTDRQKQLEQAIVAARAEMDAEEAKMGEVNLKDQPMRNVISELGDKIVRAGARCLNLRY